MESFYQNGNKGKDSVGFVSSIYFVMDMQIIIRSIINIIGKC